MVGGERDHRVRRAREARRRSGESAELRVEVRHLAVVETLRTADRVGRRGQLAGANRDHLLTGSEGPVRGPVLGRGPAFAEGGRGRVDAVRIEVMHEEEERLIARFLFDPAQGRRRSSRAPGARRRCCRRPGRPTVSKSRVTPKARGSRKVHVDDRVRPCTRVAKACARVVTPSAIRREARHLTASSMLERMERRQDRGGGRKRPRRMTARVLKAHSLRREPVHVGRQPLGAPAQESASARRVSQMTRTTDGRAGSALAASSWRATGTRPERNRAFHRPPPPSIRSSRIQVEATSERSPVPRETVSSGAP